MAGGKEPWKQLERRTAANLGGTRLWRPDFSDSIPDGESDLQTWDCKAYQAHKAVSMYVEAEFKYRRFTGARRFIMVLFARQQSRQGDFVVLRMRDYILLLQKAGELDADRHEVLPDPVGAIGSPPAQDV